MRRVLVPVVLLALLALAAGPVLAAPPVKGKAGAKGIGDPYFPTDGNGGYDVGHYDLRLAYDPSDGVLTGLATIDAPYFALGTALELEVTVEAVRHRAAATVVKTPFFNPERKIAVPPR